MADDVMTCPVAGHETNAQVEEAKEALSPTFRAAALGEIMSVFLQSPAHKSVTLGALSGMVLPAVLTKQFMLARTKSKQGDQPPTPVGVALWARVSDEVDQRLTAEPDKPIVLLPDEWRSGDNYWLVEVAAAHSVAKSMVHDLLKRMPDEQPLKTKIIGRDGKRMIKFLEAAD